MSRAAGHPVEQAMEMAEFVRQKVWDPDWSQVLVFLAGELGREDAWGGDPEKARQLVELIWSPEVEDDYFHHRLCLAAECLAEMAPSVRDREQVDRVSETLWLWVEELRWKQGNKVDWVRELGHVERGVQAVWELEGQVEGENVRERLLARVAQRDQMAFGLLEVLKPVLGLDEGFLEALVKVLLEQLRDKDWSVRKEAAEALGKLGPAVVEKPGVVEGLLERLGDEEWSVRQAAARALAALGPAVVEKPEVMEGLLDRLGDESEWVRAAAAEALGALGPAVVEKPGVVEGVVEGLLERLGEGSWWVREAAARALAALGPVVVEKPGVVEGLVESLGDKRWLVRAAAARAFGALGPAVVEKPGVVERLLARLGDEKSWVRRAAAKALKSMGRAVAGALAGNEDLLSRVELPDQSRDALEVLTGVDRAGYRIFATPGGVRAYTIEELVAGSRERVESPIKKAKGRYQRAGQSLKKRRSGRQ